MQWPLTQKSRWPHSGKAYIRGVCALCWCVICAVLRGKGGGGGGCIVTKVSLIMGRVPSTTCNNFRAHRQPRLSFPRIFEGALPLLPDCFFPPMIGGEGVPGKGRGGGEGGGGGGVLQPGSFPPDHLDLAFQEPFLPFRHTQMPDGQEAQ